MTRSQTQTSHASRYSCGRAALAHQCSRTCGGQDSTSKALKEVNSWNDEKVGLGFEPLGLHCVVGFWLLVHKPRKAMFCGGFSAGGRELHSVQEGCCVDGAGVECCAHDRME